MKKFLTYLFTSLILSFFTFGAMEVQAVKTPEQQAQKEQMKQQKAQMKAQQKAQKEQMKAQRRAAKGF
jgi:hypothetical protein